MKDVLNVIPKIKYKKYKLNSFTFVICSFNQYFGNILDLFIKICEVFGENVEFLFKNIEI